MSLLSNLYKHHNAVIDKLSFADGIAPLALRIYLFVPFYMAGSNKLGSIDDVASWFEHGLELPFPTILAYLAAYTEFFGALLLLIGLATRWISIPLIIVMLVAIFGVHWDNGWYAIAQSSDPEVASRLGAARDILQEHGKYDWLTAKGNFVILNNGIEFAVTYLIMLLSLLFTGGGRYFSLDHWLNKFLNLNTSKAQ